MKTKKLLRRRTCDIDVDRGEGRQRYSGDILSSNPQHEVSGGLVVQGLCHKDGGRTILSVGGQVEANRHIGLWDHAVLQVVSYSGIPKRGGGFDGLFKTKNMIYQYDSSFVGLLVMVSSQYWSRCKAMSVVVDDMM